MSTGPEISQRDLRMRSKEIMDAVERGQTYTVTRDGRGIGELIPIREPRRFVSREAFARSSSRAPKVDLEAFRRDLDAAADPMFDDPYAR
ncbi:type II toxin-antitoxin system Phd/YefM family antitoxin [Ruania zhangjianzhongii]|uniref:type II toxin-antitoxin system Phd/YefM family antitoxin n=1 Tax=Ruania zhangjianzhongii TaxID=2603206 RepID=UPI0011C858E5|nr:type II toxin-antitoxin system prevent-host-death family antitoxin [Ruania zhangjianzhongii]